MKVLQILGAFLLLLLISFVFLPSSALAGCTLLRVEPPIGTVNSVFTIFAQNCTEPANYSVTMTNAQNNSATMQLSRMSGVQPTFSASFTGIQLGGLGPFEMYLSENGVPTTTTADFTVNAAEEEDGDEGGGGEGGSGTTTGANPLGQEECGDTELATAIGCIPINDTNALAGFFLGWGVGIAGGVALLMIGLASYQIATSQGDPRRLQGGQELLMSAIGGLLMIVLSVYLLRFIGVDLLGIF